MIIHAEHIFGCDHLFVARPDHVICARCRHTSDLLPEKSKDTTHRLLTFPGPQFLYAHLYVEATAALG